MTSVLKQFEKSIAIANSSIDLSRLREQWHVYLEQHPNLNDIAQYIFEVNHMHDCFIRKAILLAEQAMLAKGMASPSVSYAFLLFGSGGRNEQTPWSDQDNGLVFDNQHELFKESDEIYFKELGLEIVHQLNQIGYPPCEGEVGADHPFWCKSLTAWMSTFNAWFNDPNWENIRYLLITADIRCIYGNEQLVDHMQNYIITYSDSHPAILQAMLNNTLRHKIVLNVFGQLLVEPYGEHAGCVDIKYGGYIPIINSIRLFAILSGVKETSSLKRLEELYRLRTMDEHQLFEWREALLTILSLREQAPYEFENGHYSSSGMILLKELSKDTRLKLKQALKQGRKIQKYVQQQMNIPK